MNQQLTLEDIYQGYPITYTNLSATIKLSEKERIVFKFIKFSKDQDGKRLNTLRAEYEDNHRNIAYRHDYDIRIVSPDIHIALNDELKKSGVDEQLTSSYIQKFLIEANTNRPTTI